MLLRAAPAIMFGTAPTIRWDPSAFARLRDRAEVCSGGREPLGRKDACATTPGLGCTSLLVQKRSRHLQTHAGTRMTHTETEVTREFATCLPNHLLTIPEAAEYLNVPVRWLQDAVQQRRVRCTRIGKHVRFTVSHLLELIEVGEQPVTQPVCGVVTPAGRRGRRSRL